MKALIISLFLLLAGAQWSSAQSRQDSSTAKSYTKEEQEIINLSKQKWQWMADKNVDKLNPLFHEEAKFVHMSGIKKPMFMMWRQKWLAMWLSYGAVLRSLLMFGARMQ